TLGNLSREEHHKDGFLIRRVRRPSPRKLRIVDGRPVIGIGGALWAAARGVAAPVALAAVAFRTRADAYHVAAIFPLVATWSVATLRRRRIVDAADEIRTGREGFRPVVGLVGAVERFLSARVDAMFGTTGLRADHFAEAYGIRRPRILQNRPVYRAPVESD